jgi:tetratricopeptide (TPR) repeat protein
MKLPDRYLDLSVFGYPLNLLDLEKPEMWPETDVYPPPGFIPTISLFEVGNGDTTGFYWPIGRENHEPILCDFYHDDGSLEPLASNLEGLVKLKVAEGYCDPDDDEYQAAQELADQLGFALPVARADEQLPPDLRLSLDPSSPSALKAMAAQFSGAGDLEAAITCLEHALQMLPEYTEALFMLGNLYRRQKRLPEAAHGMVEVLKPRMEWSKS